MSDPTLSEIFHDAFASGDLTRMLAAFAPDAALHSPFTRRPFEGQDAIEGVLGSIVEVLREVAFTDVLDSPDGSQALVYRAKVKDLEIEGVDLIRFDGQGRIRDFTVLVRPRSAVEALFEEMAPRLARAMAPVG